MERVKKFFVPSAHYLAQCCIIMVWAESKAMWSWPQLLGVACSLATKQKKTPKAIYGHVSHRDDVTND